MIATWGQGVAFPAEQLASAVRVEAVDLVDDGHGCDGGVVGAGEQVPCRRELAPLRYPQGQGVEHDDLGLVIAGQAGLVNDGFEVGIVAVRRGGEQRASRTSPAT
jgi:hypothetical protein